MCFEYRLVLFVVSLEIQKKDRSDRSIFKYSHDLVKGGERGRAGMERKEGRWVTVMLVRNVEQKTIRMVASRDFYSR